MFIAEAGGTALEDMRTGSASLSVGALSIKAVRAAERYEVRLDVDPRHGKAALREDEGYRSVGAADFQYFFAALRAREVREQDGVDVHAQPLARRGLDHLQRSAEQAVTVFHYVQSSSRTPTTCESPGSCSVTP